MTFAEPKDPMLMFSAWLNEAEGTELNDANAMALATVDPSGQPSVRMVLLKSVEPDGFVFYTNCESQKGRELLACPKAAICLHWKSLRRQIRVEGTVEQLDAEASNAYFASRPRNSQIGAWASQQSRPLKGRFELEQAVARATARFGLGKIPRPPYWNGFHLRPAKIEFWQDRPFRLHDRLVFSRRGEAWTTEKLYP